MKAIARIVLVSAIASTGAAANAQYSVYDSINGNTSWSGSLDSYNPSSNYSWLDHETAFQFTAGYNGDLTSIDIAAKYSGSGAGAGLLSIYSDNAGSVGSLIGSATITPAASSATGAAAVVSADFTGAGIGLVGNGKYWVAVSPAADQTVSVLYNDITATSVSSLNRGGSWLAAEYWRPTAGITVNAVPEPASLAAFGIGIAAILRRRRASK